MSMTDKLSEIQHLLKSLHSEFPSETTAFLNFMQKTESGTALDLRSKELINIALAVSAQSEWCIALHVRHALDAGARREEILDAGFMAVMMHGRPVLRYLIPLISALDEFSPMLA